MVTLKNIYIILAVAIIIACNTSSTNQQKEQIAIPSTDTIAIQSKADTTITLIFNDLTASIHGLIIYDPDSIMHQFNKDTIRLYPELAETIDGKSISIASSTVSEFTIEQRYETSVTIMNEGPHCDLTEWKHYSSNWKRLHQKEDGTFIADTYTDDDYSRFPQVSIDELNQAVREHCGDNWLEYIQNIKSPHDHPSTVTISRIFLKINGRQKDTGKIVTRLIIIEMPMGC